MSYNEFAYIYDNIIDVNYKKWVDYLEDIFNLNKISPKLILELACGTGNITFEMSKRGYDMIGLDKSCDMLSVAGQKAYESEKNILFINQDMTEFELYGSVDVVLCMMDGINYITKLDDIEKIFKLVNYYLNPGGLFIFDIRTEFALSQILGNNTFVEDTKDVTYIWQNEYDKVRKVSDMYLTFFVGQNEIYRKFYEKHSLKSYTEIEIQKELEKADLKLLNIYDNHTFDKPNEKSERVFFVAKKTK